MTDLLIQEHAPIHFAGDYEYLLAITSDSLYVMSRDKRIIESIIVGKDNEGYLCALEDEDSLLEAISVLKQCIYSGNSPVKEILNIY